MLKSAAPAEDAATHGIMLEVVKLSEVKRGFVAWLLLSRAVKLFATGA